MLAVEAAGPRDGAGLVATVGQLAARPGAPNVIPGAAMASLDVRHADDAVRGTAVAALRGARGGDRRGARARARVGRAAWRRPRWRWTPRWASGSRPRSRRPGCRSSACRAAPGHDAVALSALTGTAMLFVRCAGGVSHHPDESVDVADVAAALDVLDRFVRGLAA